MISFTWQVAYKLLKIELEQKDIIDERFFCVCKMNDLVHVAVAKVHWQSLNLAWHLRNDQ